MSLLVDHKMEEHAITNRPLEKDANKIPRYDKNFDFCSNHISLNHHKIASISCKDTSIVQSSNVDLVVKDESCVVDSCHKHFDLLYQPLETVNKTQDLGNEWLQRVMEACFLATQTRKQ